MKMRHYTGFLSKGAIGRVVTLALTFSFLSGCQDERKHQASSPSPTSISTPTTSGINLQSLTEELARRLGISPDDVNAAIGPHGEVLQAKTKEEMDKLFRWEYRVQDLSSSMPAEEFERRLGELGSDGWDCFSILPEQRSLRLTCKRRPKSAITYLKFLPGL